MCVAEKDENKAKSENAVDDRDQLYVMSEMRTNEEQQEGVSTGGRG